MHAVEVADLVKSYPKNPAPAVDHLSFTVEKGCVCGFLGPNGAGKSTLLNTICGIQEYETGEINRKSGLNIGYSPEKSTLTISKTQDSEQSTKDHPVYNGLSITKFCLTEAAHPTVED